VAFELGIGEQNQLGFWNVSVGPASGAGFVRVGRPSFSASGTLSRTMTLKCHDYYCFLMKQKWEKPSKWVKLKKEFSFDDKQVSEAFLLPVRVANEPYLRSFQYKVLNSVVFTNDRLCKIGYVSNPNCTFCHQLTETISHIFFECSFSNSFWNEVNNKNNLSKIKTCRRLSLTCHDVLVGSLEEEMDLFN